jgi:predicted RNA-binding Zn ribbon-like protein
MDGEADRALVRKCESAVGTLLFHDHTKSHRRRWCGMAVCGNREKARAHRERARDGATQ